MYGSAWANLGYAGAFVIGALAGAVVVLRLARVIADVLRDIRNRDQPKGPDP